MAVAPKSIRVLVLPQDNPDPGDKPDFRYETLETVRTDIRPSNPAPDDWATLKAVADRQAAKVHMVYYFNESTPQPNVSRLPDFGKTHWHPEAWEKRGVLGTAGYHIFFTLSNSKDLARNRNVGYAVKGDAFIVKLSDTEDDTGRRFYVDLEPGEIKRERLLELVLTVVKYPKSLSLKRLLGSSDVEDNYWEDEQNGADAPHCFYCHAKDAGAVESLDN